MKLASLLLAALPATCDGGSGAARGESTAPEIGMFAVQSVQQWQHELDEGGVGRLRGITPAGVVADSGVSWVRLALLNQMQWDSESGAWTFPTDPYIDELTRSGVRIFGTLGFGTWAEGERGRVPFDEEPTEEVEARWLEEVRALVAHHQGTVWIWQIGNEFEKKSFGLETYVRLFERGSRLVREIDPGVPVAAAGFSSGDFETFVDRTWPALVAGQAPPDVIDFHFHKYAGQGALFDEQLAELVALRDRGLPGARLIVTENSTFSGEDIPYPWEDDRPITQSEADQAAEQVKRTAIALGQGVSVSFGTDMDKLRWQDEELHPFTHNGLVYNPRRTYGAGREVRTWPKSAWWSLRLMTRLLGDHEPIDATHVVLGEPPAPRAHLVRFRARQPVYLAWSDGEQESAAALSVPGIKGRRACVTEAVLPVDGEDVAPDSWVGRFRSRSVEIVGGRVTVEFSATPVWIGRRCP
jgi:hypothetical protein